MADEQAQTSAPPEKGKGKTMIIIATLLLLEAVFIIGVMMVVGGKPDVALANIPDPETAEQERIVEIPVLDSKFANAKAGVTYLYNTEIYVQVRNKHSEQVGHELEQFSNEIKANLGAIWRTSDPRHFQEPKLENLTRKVEAFLDERFNQRFGPDEDTGEPILIKCVIVMGTGFRVDS